ncbi:MAG: hypothetical protein KGL42_07065 [Betaproteobacteria bacterium]|nr:hypothetical protein [Betaproteobacteria bacterium]
MQLRYLQTLSAIGVGDDSTAIFPLPIDQMRSIGNSIRSRIKACRASKETS